MVTVTNTLFDQAGDPALGAVEIGLVTGDPEGGWDATAHRTYIARWRYPILAADLGVWSVALQPNSSLSPSGTYYEVTERVEGTGSAKPLATTYEISVPSSGSTLYARDLLITPGTSPSASEASALANHLASTYPHATFAGTVTLGNTTTPSTPVGGGVLYVEGGSLKYKGTSGSVTTIGPP